MQARYEKEFKKYEAVPQPKIIAADIDVDLRPEAQTLRVVGRYRIPNPHAQPLRQVSISVGEDALP
jgi:hypothetical protein